jgi:hypothetical protein
LTFCKRLERKIIHIALPILFKVLISLTLFNILGGLLVLLIKKSTKDLRTQYNNSAIKNNTKNILVFNRALFDKDIFEIHKRTDLRLFIFSNDYYTMLADAILPPHLRDQIAYHIYSPKKDFLNHEIKEKINKINFNPKKDELARKRFDHIVEKIIDYVVNKLSLNGMITSNINFYQDQSWQKAFLSKNLNIFVLFKEFYGTKHSRAQGIIMDRELGLKSMANLVFVFCEWAKEILTESGMVRDENIIVTGSPRTDFIYDAYSNRKNNHQQKYKSIVLFDFLETGKEILFIDTMKIFSKMASLSNNSNVRFIVKTKTDHFKNILQNFCNKNSISLNGIKVSSDFDQEYFINNSICFIGYQTSALVEYMHTDIPILNLNWAEAGIEVDENMFVEERAAYHMIRSDNELKTAIESIINNTNIMPDGFKEERKKIIEKFLYRIDGKRSFAVANEIINAQKEPRNIKVT